MKTALRFLSFIAASLPIVASAHTGAGGTSGFLAGFGHPVGGADHLLAMVAVGLWAAQLGGRALLTVPAAFVGVMLAGGALGISGFALPYVEQGILVSVLVLGVLISAAVRVPVAAGTLIVGAFAVFHGHAHGQEMPAGLGTLSYSAGFALATVLLHGAGMASGIALSRSRAAGLVRAWGAAIALGGACLALA